MSQPLARGGIAALRPDAHTPARTTVPQAVNPSPSESHLGPPTTAATASSPSQFTFSFSFPSSSSASPPYSPDSLDSFAAPTLSPAAYHPTAAVSAVAGLSSPPVVCSPPLSSVPTPVPRPRVAPGADEPSGSLPSVSVDKLDPSSHDAATAAARGRFLRESVFPQWGEREARGLDESADELQQKDPLATQIWKLYSRTKSQLPNQERMENLTWRLMTLNLKREQRLQRVRRSFSNSNHSPRYVAVPLTRVVLARAC